MILLLMLGWVKEAIRDVTITWGSRYTNGRGGEGWTSVMVSIEISQVVRSYDHLCRTCSGCSYLSRAHVLNTSILAHEVYRLSVMLETCLTRGSALGTPTTSVDCSGILWSSADWCVALHINQAICDPSQPGRRRTNYLWGLTTGATATVLLKSRW